MSDPSKVQGANSLFVFGLGSLGHAVGYFVAFSQFPVIGVLLPLLFGLIGGGGGLYLTQTKLDTKQASERLRLLGLTCLVFSIAVVGSSAVGLYFKQPKDLLSNLDSLQVETIRPTDAVRLIALRRKLQLLGASPPEQERILTASSKPLMTPAAEAKEIVSHLLALSSESNECLVALTTAMNSLTKEMEPVRRAATQLSALQATNAVVFKFWAMQVEHGTTVNSSLVADRIKKTNEAVAKYLWVGNAEDQTAIWASQHPKLIHSLAKLETTLATSLPRLEAQAVYPIPKMVPEDLVLVGVQIPENAIVSRGKTIGTFAYNPKELIGMYDVGPYRSVP